MVTIDLVIFSLNLGWGFGKIVPREFFMQFERPAFDPF